MGTRHLLSFSNTSSSIGVRGGAALFLLRDLHRALQPGGGPVHGPDLHPTAWRSASPSRTPCSACMTPASPGSSGAAQSRVRPLVPWPLGLGGAHRGRPPGLDSHLRAAAALSEPAPAGRLPPRRAAGELILPALRGCLVVSPDGLVVVLALAVVVVDDPQDLDEAERGAQPPQGRLLVGVDRRPWSGCSPGRWVADPTGQPTPLAPWRWMRDTRRPRAASTSARSRPRRRRTPKTPTPSNDCGPSASGHRLWWSFLALQLTDSYQAAASPEADREGAGDLLPFRFDGGPCVR
jgi:hypothetical protein